MSLLTLLQQHGFQWSVADGVYVEPSPPLPCILVTLTKPGVGSFSYRYPTWEVTQIEDRLAFLLRKHFKGDAVREAYRREQGHVPAKLNGLTAHELGNAIHTALRKLRKACDTKASEVTYNALQQIPSKAYRVFMARIHEALVAIAPEHALVGATRRELGETIRRAATEAAKDLHMDAVMAVQNLNYAEDPVEDSVAKAKTEAYAQLMLVVGCEMTEIDEWTHGWLAYVVTNVELEPAQ